jgi:hypothetical protein
VQGGTPPMMGQQRRTESLFYYFRLEEQIPTDHLLRMVAISTELDFGTTENQISGKGACKRRSAKALYDSPSLLEGRHTFQISYARYFDCEKLRVFATIHLSPFGSMGTTWVQVTEGKQ